MKVPWKTSRTNFLGTLCEGLKLMIDGFLGHFSTILRVNVSKNQGKLKKRGHGQKIDCAHTLSV